MLDNPWGWGDDCEKEGSGCVYNTANVTVFHDLRVFSVKCYEKGHGNCYIHSGGHFRAPVFVGYIDNIKVPEGY